MSFDRDRERMVAEQLQARGLTDVRVLTAMLRVPRHLFVDGRLSDQAYDDTPLPIGPQQTISQPYMVALMTAALEVSAGMRVLEIGTGSGYQAAILAELGALVTTVECVPMLAERARTVLASLGLAERVTVVDGDGTLGAVAGGPYDGILVTAAAPQIPRPLLDQLAPGGRLVLPMGERELQTLIRLRREVDGSLVDEVLGDCRFVPLLGEHGWRQP